MGQIENFRGFIWNKHIVRTRGRLNREVVITFSSFRSSDLSQSI
jgi:hypothetical protein